MFDLYALAFYAECMTNQNERPGFAHVMTQHENGEITLDEVLRWCFENVEVVTDDDFDKVLSAASKEFSRLKAR